MFLRKQYQIVKYVDRNRMTLASIDERAISVECSIWNRLEINSYFAECTHRQLTLISNSILPCYNRSVLKSIKIQRAKIDTIIYHIVYNVLSESLSAGLSFSFSIQLENISKLINYLHTCRSQLTFCSLAYHGKWHHRSLFLLPSPCNEIK